MRTEDVGFTRLSCSPNDGGGLPRRAVAELLGGGLYFAFVIVQFSWCGVFSRYVKFPI